MTPRRVDCIVFDLDGTLIDSRDDIATAVNHTLNHFGYGALDPAVIHTFIGHGAGPLLQDSLKAAGVDLASLNPEIFEKGRSVFLGFYSDHLLDRTRLYPGVEGTLRHFHEKKLIVLSNKPEMLSRKILEGLGVSDCFRAIFGGESLPYKKPDPRALLDALRRVDASPESAAFVGDSVVDLETGAGAGVFTCAVTYGLGAPEDLRAKRPDLILEKISDLSHHLC